MTQIEISQKSCPDIFVSPTILKPVLTVLSLGGEMWPEYLLTLEIGREKNNHKILSKIGLSTEWLNQSAAISTILFFSHL